MNMADNLKVFRKACGLTQEDMGEALGVDRSTYTYYETGRSSPSLENLIRIIRILGINSVDTLLGIDKTSGEISVSAPPIIYGNPEQTKAFMPSLSKEETMIVLDYRQLSADQKVQLKSSLEELKERALMD